MLTRNHILQLWNNWFFFLFFKEIAHRVLRHQKYLTYILRFILFVYYLTPVLAAFIHSALWTFYIQLWWSLSSALFYVLLTCTNSIYVMRNIQCIPFFSVKWIMSTGEKKIGFLIFWDGHYIIELDIKYKKIMTWREYTEYVYIQKTFWHITRKELQKQFITIKSYLFTIKAYFVHIKQGKEKNK